MTKYAQPIKSFENNSVIPDFSLKECSVEAINKKEIDGKSPETILKKKLITQCKYFFKSKKYIGTKFKQPKTNPPKLNIQKFCYSNLTLSFHIIDSLENYDFIRKFLPNLNITTQESKAFIIDSLNERSFVLKKPSTFYNHIEFINDFYSETLEKLQRTTFTDVKKNSPLISFTELTTQSFKEVTYREYENVS